MMMMVFGFSAAAPSVATQQCKISVDVSTGGYSVLIGGDAWLHSAPTRFHANGKWFSSHDSTLLLKSSATEDGEDGIGRFNSTTLTWTAGSTKFETVFRQYASGSCVFEQRFPDGVRNMSTGNVGQAGNLLASAFPSFDLNVAAAAASASKGYYLWQGGGVPAMEPWRRDGTGVGVWPPQHAITESCKAVQTPVSCSLVGVLALFEESLAHTAVISPASNFLAAAMHFEPADGGDPALGRRLSYGMHARIEKVPADFRLATIVHGTAAGPNVAMREWGAALLRRSGKPRGAWRSDRSLQMLGYTTDNGAYYYYNTINRTCYHTYAACVGYEETVLALKKHADDLGLPFRWILYDSWFYSKADVDSAHPYSYKDGVTNWTEAAPEIFPSGLLSLYERTGWNVVGHNRAWATSNVYDVTNGGKFEFMRGRDNTGLNWSLPVHEAFWDYLFETDQRWGLWNYQQDWMYTQQGMQQMQTDPTLAAAWTMQMDAALVRRGMHFGFGGVTLADWLQGTEMLSASNGRISDDYHAGLSDYNWQIGEASIFAWAIDLIPAKDGFWSTAVQPGHPYPEGANRTEPFAALNAAVATLSRGPVTPADGIGHFNASLIMRACMADGQLLQPDAPALALDTQIRRLAFGAGGPDGQVWSTSSEVGGRTYHQLLVAQLREAYTCREWPPPPGDTEDASQAAPTRLVISNADGVAPTTAVAIDGTVGVALAANDRVDFELLHASPVLPNGWSLLGETSKWVPVTSQRVVSIALADKAVEVAVRGVDGEAVSLSFAFSAEVAAGKRLLAGTRLAVTTTTCILPESGMARISMPSKQCAPL